MKKISLQIQKILKTLPKTPGVYLLKDKMGQIIYVGKAGVLKNRVTSYFGKAHDLRIEQLVKEIADIETKKTPTIIEALILEANLIKKYLPKYNIREKDDKSFLYAVITKDKFPKIKLLRGLELEKENQKQFKKIFGPFTSAAALRDALKILQKIFHWSNCEPRAGAPCFNYGIGLCPGICVGKISPQEYLKTIRRLILFFDGKKSDIIKNLQKEMKAKIRTENFEEAARFRNQVFALEHIQDIALIKKEENEKMVNIYGRIEGYDISDISGTDSVGSMVVFTNAEPEKSEYRKFKIKTVLGINDTAMIREILTRRFGHNWRKPDLILIDGGRGQTNAAHEALGKLNLKIPIIGIAKGITRKKDEFITTDKSPELKRLIENNPLLLKQVRDEAHRFAIAYHRKLRNKIKR